MKTISSHVESWLDANPFVAQHLSQGLINHSALARSIKPDIEKKTSEKVSIEAITIALNRIGKELGQVLLMQDYSGFINDVSLQTDQTIITFSSKDIDSQSFPQKPEQPDDLFIIIQGVWHTQIVAKTNLIDSHEFTVSPQSRTDDIASLTVRLNPAHAPTPGVGAYILSRIAAKNISIEDAISAHDEFIVLMKKDVAHDALKTLL